MSVYAGIFNTTLNPQELNMKSFAGTILRRVPNGSAPLLAMTSVVGSTTAKASTHGYFSKTMVFASAVVTAEAAAADTVLTVENSDGLTKGMIFYNEATGENMRLELVNGLNLTVKRQTGRIAAAIIAANTKLIVIGTAFEEGSQRPTARSIQPVYVPNFTQIFRNAWALTDTARASYAEAGYSNITESRRDCMDFHATEQETAIFFGQAFMGTYNGQPLHTTQGIVDAVRQYAPDNVNAMPNPTAVTYDDVVDATIDAFKWSVNVGDNTQRVMFCDTVGMRTMQDIGRFFGEVTVTQRETSYGMVFTEWKFFKGRLILKEHPLFSAIGISPGFAVVVDVPAVKLAYMDGRNAKVENYGQGGGENKSGATDYSYGHGVDAQGGSLTSEWALELLNPQGCAVITGLQKAKERVYLTAPAP
ncbi:hypothetical protein 20Aug470_00016 [Pseudomonas phage 20Aug470]|nr:hypothetical protein 20Aug470_00016 [Pseudomonas phage 20Aug470]